MKTGDALMLPRERVIAAIDHRKPDRVPVDFWAEDPVWDRLLGDLGLKTRDVLLERLDVDVRYIPRSTRRMSSQMELSRTCGASGG